MPDAEGFRRFDLDEMSARDRYKLLIGSLVPRPIAWITTADPQGRINAAPFSFFNALSSDPAIVGIGIENHADGSPKGTGRNIRDTGAFTVNIAGTGNLEAMHGTAVAFGREVDELQAAGLIASPGHRVKSPFIADAPVALDALGRMGGAGYCHGRGFRSAHAVPRGVAGAQLGLCAVSLLCSSGRDPIFRYNGLSGFRGAVLWHL
jgi:flavin reductase (DIM6/NTAB) family NADH-FMN oxidoreductase RutF